MRNWQNELRRQLEQYTRLKEQVCSQLEAAPLGKLVLSYCQKKYLQFYCYEAENKNAGHKGQFISSKNTELIKELAQKDYNQKLLCKLEEQSKVISDFLEKYEDDFAREVYISVRPEVQKLVTPIVPTEAEIIEKWMKNYQGSKNPIPITSEIITNRGEKVRSKSEKILADRLNQLEIPYKYECPLFLKSLNKYIYPDFQCLNTRTRKVYIWEHMGMMDAPEYVEQANMRLANYQKEEIFPGEKLILTFETKNMSTSQTVIDHLIETYLK